MNLIELKETISQIQATTNFPFHIAEETNEVDDITVSDTTGNIILVGVELPLSLDQLSSIRGNKPVTQHFDGLCFGDDEVAEYTEPQYVTLRFDNGDSFRLYASRILHAAINMGSHMASFIDRDGISAYSQHILAAKRAGTIDENMAWDDGVLFAVYSDSSVFVVPDGITELAESAFEGINNLQEVVLPDSLRVIGERAFFNCTKLSTIELPPHLSQIGPDAFTRCLALEKLSIPDSVTAIDKSAFFLCMNLKQVSIPANCDYDAGTIFSDCGDIVTRPAT